MPMSLDALFPSESEELQPTYIHDDSDNGCLCETDRNCNDELGRKSK